MTQPFASKQGEFEAEMVQAEARLAGAAIFTMASLAPASATRSC
jgi:hypothetical protein